MTKLSQAEYARLRNVSRKTVNNLIRSGVIPQTNGKIDVALADAACLERLNPALSPLAAQIDANMSQSPIARQTVSDAAPPSEDQSENTKSYHAARTMREKYAALAAKLEYLKMLGTLVESEPVTTAARDLGRQVRDALLNIPARVSNILAAESDAIKIDALLSAEIRKTCDGLADDLKQRYG